MSLLTSISATQLVKGMQAKKFSCVEVITEYLAQIKSVNPKINALVQQIDESLALKLAKEADDSIAKGLPLGKLHGLPMTIKDHLKVKDFIVTRGSLGFKNNRCTENAEIVRRLKNEGAIILGITNMPEWGPCFEAGNDVYGQTNNPYDLTKTSGGSSGGEAALIACGGSAAGIGTDGGGSIRVPASFSGVAGIKPTQHLVPCTGNVPGDGGMTMQFYTPGPMARYVEDLRIILPIISGTDGIDPYTIQTIPTTQESKPLKSMKIAYYLGENEGFMDNNVVKALENTKQVFSEHNIEVTPINNFDLYNIGKFHFETYFYAGDQGLALKEALEKIGVNQPSKLLQNFLDAAAKFQLLTAKDLRQRLLEVDKIKMNSLKLMENFDILICPVCATTAKTHGTTQAEIEHFYYSSAFNLLGWPSTSVRVGSTNNNLPIGIQVVAKPWMDYDSLLVAEFLQNQIGGWQIPEIAKSK